MTDNIRALPAPTRRIDGKVYAAQLEAERIVADARAAAGEILEAAHAEADGIRACAQQAGRADGWAEAAESVAWAAAERDRLLGTAEPEVVRLALAVAEKVLGREAEVGRGVAPEMARRALAEARERTCVALRIHPLDLAEVRAQEPALDALVSRASGIAWISDPAVGRGGAVVETETGSIDGRLDAQLEAIRKVLAGALQ